MKKRPTLFATLMWVASVVVLIVAIIAIVYFVHNAIDEPGETKVIEKTEVVEKTVTESVITPKQSTSQPPQPTTPTTPAEPVTPPKKCRSDP